jgi:SWI/SNF-related matrix-associated actin-dependent regulator of chromatin subfamily A member 5
MENVQSKSERNRQRRKDLQDKKQALDRAKAADSIKRYKYLLGQTDIFKHFINSSKLGIDLDVEEK